VVFAATLLPGTAYQQYTDLFAVAMIGTVVLWSGRYGGRLGLALLVVAALTEVLKAPVNAIPLRSIDGWVIATRVTWSACGLLVAVLGVRVLLQFADRDERLSEDQQILHRAARTHDIAKQALSAVHRILSSQLPNEVRVQEAGEVTAWAVNEMAEPLNRSASPTSTSSIAEVVDEVFRGVRLLHPTIVLQAVDAVHRRIEVGEPSEWLALIRNLVLNGAQHSGGTQVTVRWLREGEMLLMTVKDDGRGLSRSDEGGTGLALVRAAAEKLGARLSVTSASGCRWELRVPDIFSSDNHHWRLETS
jgi:signal transduction histidine kinase